MQFVILFTKQSSIGQIFLSKFVSDNSCSVLLFQVYTVAVIMKAVSYPFSVVLVYRYEIQSNFNGSNTFGTMQISSRQGKFEPVRVDYSARSGGLIGISFLFSLI